MRRLLAAAVLSLAASPTVAAIVDEDVLKLVCRADNPAMLSEPLTFAIDLAAKRALEVSSGDQYGVTAYRDGLGLWPVAEGPGAVAFRIDRVKGRFARVDRQERMAGTCEEIKPTL